MDAESIRLARLEPAVIANIHERIAGARRLKRHLLTDGMVLRMVLPLCLEFPGLGYRMVTELFYET
jgi:hypothetical protein